MSSAATSRGTFPAQLHYALQEMEREGQSHIASWQPHGRSFKVHKRGEFVKVILPCWFRMSKFTSFQRQINMYGFKRIASGPDKDSYCHALFVQHQPILANDIKRIAVKGQGPRRPRSLLNDPNFYALSSLATNMSKLQILAQSCQQPGAWSLHRPGLFQQTKRSVSMPLPSPFQARARAAP